MPEGHVAARPRSRDRAEGRPDVPTVHADQSAGHEGLTEEVPLTPPVDTDAQRARCEDRTAAQPRELPAHMDRERSRAVHTEARPTPAARTPRAAATTIARRGVRTGSTDTGGPSLAIPAGAATGPMGWRPDWRPSPASRFCRRDC